MLLYYSKCWAEERLIVELLFAVPETRTVLNKMSFKINPRVKFTDEGILRVKNVIQQVLNELWGEEINSAALYVFRDRNKE